MENVLREIGFDSKPISKIYCKEEMYLKVGVGGGGNSCKEGRDTRMTRRDKRSKKKETKTIFFNSKSISKIGFEQMHNCKRATVNAASPRTGVR